MVSSHFSCLVFLPAAVALAALPSVGRCSGENLPPLCGEVPVNIAGEGPYVGSTVVVRWDITASATNAVALAELCALGEQLPEQCEEMRQQFEDVAPIHVRTGESDARASPVSRAQLFDAIYATDFWAGEGNNEHGISSGKGSRPGRGVAALRRVLRDAARGDFGASRPIRTVLEIGCGDASWLGGDPIAPLFLQAGVEVYRGVDVSAVALARRRPRSVGIDSSSAVDVELVALDAVSAPLDGAALRSDRVARDGGWDLVIIRDVHGHLRPSEILELYRNIAVTAKPRFVLAKTFARRAGAFEPLVHLANGRRVNLLLAPYCFGDPERLEREEEHGAFMGLWNGTPASLSGEAC